MVWAFKQKTCGCEINKRNKRSVWRKTIIFYGDVSINDTCKKKYKGCVN